MSPSRPREPRYPPGGVTPELPPVPEPASEPLEPDEAPGPAAYDLLARFTTASRALTFAEQVMRAAQHDNGADCSRSADGCWWVMARLPLAIAREMAGLGEGRLYILVAGGFVADRGWGDGPADGRPATLPDRRTAGLLDLVEVAGLHRVRPGPVREAYVLAPGYLVHGILDRALDLRLRASYQLAHLKPLFGRDGAARSCYAVHLTAGAKQDALPTALLAALADDPFTLVCRRADETLLVGYGEASPLSDQALTRLVAAHGGGTWMLAGPPDGCARVSWDAEPLDASGLVRLSPGHALLDADGGQPYLEAAAASPPAPRTLTVVPTSTHTAGTDAMLLSDADLECLPLLLAGEPIADSAFLVRGTGRHLVTAPGGLLTEIAVGEPLTCIGPGSIYVPTGYRLDPPLGPAARAALLRPEKQVAQVMLDDARVGYDLDAAEPLWTLWAGPVPALEGRLSRQAVADLEQTAREVGEQPRPASHPQNLRERFWSRRPADPEPSPDAWRNQALRAERDRDYITAAQLYARNNEPLRAARMWEREAQEKY